MDDPVMEPTEAARRRPLDDGAAPGAEAPPPPMMTGRHSTRFAGSAVVPSGPQSSPARGERSSNWFAALRPSSSKERESFVASGATSIMCTCKLTDSQAWQTVQELICIMLSHLASDPSIAHKLRAWRATCTEGRHDGRHLLLLLLLLRSLLGYYKPQVPSAAQRQSERTIVERPEQAVRDGGAVAAEGCADGQARVGAAGREDPEAARGGRADARAQQRA